MSRKKLYFVSNLLKLIAATSILSPIAITSCSTTNQHEEKHEVIQNENENKDQEKEIIDYQEPKIYIDWIRGYSNLRTIYNNSNNFIFQYNEKIWNDDFYKIEYDGLNNNNHIFSIFVKKINKYYTFSIDTRFDIFTKIYSIAKIKETLAKNIIKDFEQKMIVEHKISDDNFYLPLDTSDNSITFLKNNQAIFTTYLWMFRTAKTDVVFNMNFDLSKIEQMLFGNQKSLSENFRIKDIHLSDLYILPKVIYYYGSLEYCKFNINSITNNNKNKNVILTQNEKEVFDLKLPFDRQNQKSWIYQNAQGTIENNYFTNGVAQTINNEIENDLNKLNNVNERLKRSNKEKIKQYYNEIINRGKRIKINESYQLENSKENISYNLFSSIEAGGKSPNPFKGETKVGLYNIFSILKLKVNLIEYKKFNL